MFCSQCGKEVSEGSKFCSNCGAKIEIAEERNIDVAKDEIQMDEIKETVKDEIQKDEIKKVEVSESANQKKSANWLMPAIIGLALLVIVIIVIVVVRGKQKAEVSEPETIVEEEITNTEEVSQEIEEIEEEPAEEELIEDPLADNKDVAFVGDFTRDDNVTRKLVKRLIDKKNADPSKILFVSCSDFDRDDNAEAFVFVGELVEDGMSYYDGTGWFVTDDTIRAIDDPSTGMWENVGRFIDCGNRQYFVLDELYATAIVSQVYSVKDGEMYEDVITGKGYLDFGEDEQFVITGNDYDVMYDSAIGTMIGHSWKPYYFKYDSASDSIVELETKDVPLAKLNEVCGTDIVSEIELLEGYFISAYERENGLVNINYLIPDESGAQFCNATWDKNKKEYTPAWDLNDKSFSGSNYDGYYRTSLFEMDKNNADDAKTQELELIIYSAGQYADMGDKVILFGENCNDEKNPVPMERLAIIIDDNTKITSNSDVIAYEGGSTLEWIKALVNPSEDDLMMGINILGIWDVTTKGSHVETINGTYWWD